MTDSAHIVRLLPGQTYRLAGRLDAADAPRPAPILVTRKQKENADAKPR